MSRITLEQAARWCGGTVAPQYAQVEFLGATNDSRQVQPGQLFVALQGARDGHAYIPDALSAAPPPCCAAAATEIIRPL